MIALTRLALTTALGILVSGCVAKTNPHTGQPVSARYQAQPVVALKCTFAGSTISTVSSIRLYRRPGADRYLVYRQTNFLSGARFTVGEPSVNLAESFDGQTATVWYQTEEKYQGMNKVTVAEGHLINTKTGKVTTLRRENNQIKKGYENQCDYDPVGMKAVWMAE